MYAMALDAPRKSLKWFNLRTLEQQLLKEKQRNVERFTPLQAHTSRYPSPGKEGLLLACSPKLTVSHTHTGTYTMDDASGTFEMWIQNKAMTQNFLCTLRRKQGGRYISIAVTKYQSTSKSGTAALFFVPLCRSHTLTSVRPGITTDYDSVPIAPFHFYRLPPHLLDPVEEST